SPAGNRARGSAWHAPAACCPAPVAGPAAWKRQVQRTSATTPATTRARIMQAMNEHAKPCGWTLVSLRPQGQQAALRAAARAAGATDYLALPPWRLQRQDSPHSRRQLQQALGAARTLFTSPAAVAAAAALEP